MASTSSQDMDSPPEPSGNHPPTIDLAQEIENGSVDIERIKRLCDQTNIDHPNKDGRTPLMAACIKGCKEFVQLLLERGANPNLQCHKRGNTPLHYACVNPTPTETNCLQVEEDNRSAIVDLLLTYGAKVLKNNDGLTPPSTAGFFGFGAIVKIFETNEQVDLPIVEKVRSLELLGFSEINRNYTKSLNCETQFKRAHEAFCRAIEYRQRSAEDFQVSGECNNSHLVDRFTSSMVKECVTVNEIMAIRKNTNALKLHAMLVGDRVLPERMKQEILCPQILDFADSCLSDTVGINNVYPLLESLIMFYTKVITNACDQSLIRSSNEIFGEILDILFQLAFEHSVPEVLDSVLSSVLQVVRRIHQAHRATRQENTKCGSVAYALIDKLGEAFVDNIYCGMTSGSIKRVKYVVSRLLSCEDVAYTDSEDGETMLHTLMYLVPVARDFDYILDFARILVSHGCPVNVENTDGQTARDILKDAGDHDHDAASSMELYNLISSPVIPLRLEEIAARKILQFRIPYQALLPPVLREIVQRGTCRLELTDLNSDDDSSDENDG